MVTGGDHAEVWVVFILRVYVLKELGLSILLVLNLGSTWFMTGLIWFVQIVHYPQFAGVGTEAFAAYHRRHTTATTWVVGPPMLIEAVTTALLLWVRPSGMSMGMAIAGVTLLVIIWASTALLQVPTHDRLAAGGFNEKSGQWLCRTNWIRTVCWTARGILMGWVVLRSIH